MPTTHLKAETVRHKAQGQWLKILGALAPELSKAIEKPGRHVPCPVHGGKDGFRLFRNASLTGGGVCNTCGFYPDGFALLMWLTGWSFPDALIEVGRSVGAEFSALPAMIIPRKHLPKPVKPSRQDLKLRALLRKVWRESYPLDHPYAEPVRLYLQNRGLDGLLPGNLGLRCHPNMQYRDPESEIISHYPAMLALIENNGKPITIHRTFLTPFGEKAPVTSPRMMMPIPVGNQPLGGAFAWAIIAGCFLSPKASRRPWPFSRKPA